MKQNPDTELPKEPKIKIYTALLTQTGTNAPIATVLQNSLGQNIVWTRVGPGEYIGTTTNGFPEGKTAPSIAGGYLDGYNFIRRNNENEVFIGTQTQGAGNTEDDWLNNTKISIEIYNI